MTMLRTRRAGSIRKRPSMVIPAPGAVCPAMVTSPFLITTSPRMAPLTANTMIRGPGRSSAACRLPAPSGASVVTRTTLPPRPPVALAPKPCAPGKDGKLGAMVGVAPPEGLAGAPGLPTLSTAALGSTTGGGVNQDGSWGASPWIFALFKPFGVHAEPPTTAAAASSHVAAERIRTSSMGRTVASGRPDARRSGLPWDSEPP